MNARVVMLAVGRVTVSGRPSGASRLTLISSSSILKMMWVTERVPAEERANLCLLVHQSVGVSVGIMTTIGTHCPMIRDAAIWNSI